MGIFIIVWMILQLINIFFMYHWTLGMRKIPRKLSLGLYKIFYMIVTPEIKIFLQRFDFSNFHQNSYLLDFLNYNGISG